MKIGIIGAGAMGSAMARGFLAGHAVAPADVTVANPHAAKLEPLKALGAQVTTSNVQAAEGADFVILAVKPWVVVDVLSELKPVLQLERQAIVNVAASVTGQEIIDALISGGLLPAVFQVIPNTAIAHGASMTFIAQCSGSEEQLRQLQALYDSCGRTLVLEEHQMAAATALSSCGIAYAMRYVRAASEGGVELGFKADVAKDIVLQTLQGAVSLLQASGNHPEAEIDKVTTPGGLTIRGLNAMEAHGFTTAVIEGLKASMPES